MRARITPFLLVIGLLSSCNGDTTVSASEDKTTTVKESHLSIKMVELKRRGGGAQCPEEAVEENAENSDALCAIVKLTYPQISSNVKPELADKLNHLILQQLIDSADGDTNTANSLEAFADNFIADYTKDPNPFSSWELERSVKVTFNNEKLLTLSFEEYGYTGGAHPFNGQRYSVIDLDDGESVVLADLFNPGYEPPLNVTGEKAFRKARGLNDADSLEEQGFSFENNVFYLNSNFGVLEDGLQFIFNSYEIAPYAMGPTAFAIPYEDINALIRTDGLLSHAVQ